MSTASSTLENTNRKTGDSGERIAAGVLKKAGYKIIETNHKNPLGEIDLVTRHNSQIVFVEVKTRTTLSHGTGAEAVTRAKQRHIIRTALYYLKTNNKTHADIRFDVVDINLGAGTEPETTVIENAFGLNY